MKKLLCILLIFPLFIACSNDDEEESFDITPIVGKWLQEEVATEGFFRRYYFEFHSDTTLTYKWGSPWEEPSTYTAQYDRLPFKIKDNGIYIYDNNRPTWIFEIIDSDNIMISSWINDPFEKHHSYTRIK